MRTVRSSDSSAESWQEFVSPARQLSRLSKIVQLSLIDSGDLSMMSDRQPVESIWIKKPQIESN